ncbi:MAG: hypothetical protein QOJ63_844 [Solirubrobacteraceae bacterium]|nr:hypothetical protein [Solirubrobacteraceae bacterium]
MTDCQFTQQDLEEAYAAGDTDAHRELLPFHGVDRVVFPTDREQFAGSAEDFLGQLQASVTGRNTLVVLAEAVAEQKRVQRRRRVIGADEDDGASDVA